MTIIKWHKRDCGWDNTEKKVTVSGPTTFVGGGMDRNVFLSSGPGLFRDRRLRAVDWDDVKPILLNGFAAKSRPW